MKVWRNAERVESPGYGGGGRRHSSEDGMLYAEVCNGTILSTRKRQGVLRHFISRTYLL